MSKYSKALTLGLKNAIIEVEKLPKRTIFDMVNYKKCVIGKILKNRGEGEWSYKGSSTQYSEAQILYKFFGISRSNIAAYFSAGSAHAYKPEHWEVIRLFTGSIGERIDRDKWLELAKKQLELMKSEY